jgi:hypothetical protein
VCSKQATGASYRFQSFKNLIVCILSYANLTYPKIGIKKTQAGRTMKRLLISAVSLAALSNSAFAADLPSRKEPVAAPPPPMMWTGFHIGLNAGGTWGAGGNTNISTWPTVLANTGPGDFNR